MSLNIALITLTTLMICLQLKFHAVQFLEFGNELDGLNDLFLQWRIRVRFWGGASPIVKSRESQKSSPTRMAGELVLSERRIF